MTDPARCGHSSGEKSERTVPRMLLKRKKAQQLWLAADKRQGLQKAISANQIKSLS